MCHLWCLEAVSACFRGISPYLLCRHCAVLGSALLLKHCLIQCLLRRLLRVGLRSINAVRLLGPAAVRCACHARSLCLLAGLGSFSFLRSCALALALLLLLWW